MMLTLPTSHGVSGIWDLGLKKKLKQYFPLRKHHEIWKRTEAATTILHKVVIVFNEILSELIKKKKKGKTLGRSGSVLF